MNKRAEHPEPLQWMHASEGAMHSREATIPSLMVLQLTILCVEVFREREREAGLRNDAPIRSDLAGYP